MGHVEPEKGVGTPQRRLGLAYELILVLDDADRPRVSLATYPERTAAAADAATLADFLGVPLLDETPGKTAKEAVGDAEARHG
jgi:hypothetical protein